jgi:hypothetical protein
VEIAGAPSASAAVASPSTARLKSPGHALGAEVDAVASAAVAPIGSLSRSEPPGLLFSPHGLSVGGESRFIADL